MEADGLWKAALRSARLSTALGKRRVKPGVSHSSHSPRQRRNHSWSTTETGPTHRLPIFTTARRPSPLILFKASSMSPVNVLDLSGTFKVPKADEGSALATQVLAT